MSRGIASSSAKCRKQVISGSLWWAGSVADRARADLPGRELSRESPVAVQVRLLGLGKAIFPPDRVRPRLVATRSEPLRPRRNRVGLGWHVCYGGTVGSNPIPSSAESVSAGHLTATGEKAGTSAALAHKWRREKGRAASKPAFLGCLSLAGIGLQTHRLRADIFRTVPHRSSLSARS
jgi:hypothetical protein